MATIKEVIALCKEGKLQTAYNEAQNDLDLQPDSPWPHREMGWVLYYKLKQTAETGSFEEILSLLNELQSLSLLEIPQDNIIYDNVLFALSSFIKNHIGSTAPTASAQLSTLFAWLRNYNFEPSKGYSLLLKNMLRHSAWPELGAFVEWWDLSKLQQEDYAPFVMANSKSIMSLAEQVYIGYSKIILASRDRNKIQAFLPQLEALQEKHPEMLYPGYFYGKLLLATDNNPHEALKTLLPFARKKYTEFWVWQLLGEVFADDADKCLACLLRAAHCRSQEIFLLNVYIQLAHELAKHQLYPLAKFYVDKLTHIYLRQGKMLPMKMDVLIHEPWLRTTIASEECPIDYMLITNEILCEGANKVIGVVINIDAKSHKAYVVYGDKKQMSFKMRQQLNAGDIINIYYTVSPLEEWQVFYYDKASFCCDLTYARIVQGKIDKQERNDFAFLKTSGFRAFINPHLVNKFHLENGETIEALIVYNFNRKKEEWSWSCVKINKSFK